jgi:hypothetical protein
VGTLQHSGLSIANLSGNTLQGLSNWSACAGHVPSNQVYLEAFYINDTNVQVGQIGLGSMSHSARGVQVTRLNMCAPSFFGGVIGRRSFDVGASDLAGLSQTTAAFDLAKAPFYIYGHQCELASCTPFNPPTNTTPPTNTYTLFEAGATKDFQGPALPAVWTSSLPTQVGPSEGFTCPDTSTHSNSPIPCSGDLVTIHDKNNGGSSANSNWDVPQFVTWNQGVNNSPYPGVTLHDASDRGCLDINVTGIIVGDWTYNHGGGGHCAPPPLLYDTVTVPIVDNVCKDNICQDGTVLTGTSAPACTGQPPGGYCIHVVGFVLVYIATITGGPGGNLVEGYITGIQQDPYCIVEGAVGTHHNIPVGSPYWLGSFVAGHPGYCPGEY